MHHPEGRHLQTGFLDTQCWGWSATLTKVCKAPDKKVRGSSKLCCATSEAPQSAAHGLRPCNHSPGVGWLKLLSCTTVLTAPVPRTLPVASLGNGCSASSGRGRAAGAALCWSGAKEAGVALRAGERGHRTSAYSGLSAPTPGP